MDAELIIDIDSKWTARQAQATEAADTHRFTLYGGARGPGKSYWLRWWLLRFLVQCGAAGLRGVHAGLFCETYPELRDRQISKIESEFPRAMGDLKEDKASGLGFHLTDDLGGGVLALRNLDKPEKYQSAEFAAIGVDELTKNKLSTWNTLRGSLRWAGIRNTRFVAGTNPGGIGHLWVKSYWIDREYPPEMVSLADEFAFVPGLPDDNPYLDESYWHELSTLPPELARAWRWGDWDVFAGQAFGEWSRGNHVCRPFEIPKHWARWRSVDWGRANPFCALWLAQDPDIGRVYVYRELYETGLTDRQQARLIAANTPETVNITLADPSMWTRKTHEDTTFSTADEYRAEGVVLTQADNDRMTGKRKVDNLLMPLPDGKPGLVVFENCANLIRTLPALPYDSTNVEDIDSDAEDHAYDALRYGLSKVNPRPRPQPAPIIVDPMMKKIIGSRAGMASRDL